jgi:quinoprotein glucose dehydrogenase
MKLLVSVLLCAALLPSVQAQNQSWPTNHGAPGNGHYSPLFQINRDNISHLEIAWTYDTHETGGLQTCPIVIDGVLYAVTPSQKVFALDAASGKELWKFDSGVPGTQPIRGVAFWSPDESSGSSKSVTSVEAKRVLVGVTYYLYALDAATGRPIPTFGQNGRIDLREGLGRILDDAWLSLTSPGVIYKDEIIIGGRNSETLPAAPGDVRAFDVRTGKQRWTFHTIPHPGEFGYETWPPDAWKTSGAANNWAGMAVDTEKGIVYVPTGSAAFDFYGGDRIGDDLFANTLLALDAETGKRIWHFQAVHHDIWDRDFPSAPALVTIRRGGKSIGAVAQTTKQGFVYLFNRTTGEPLFPIGFKKYPPSTVPGEKSAAEQPLPTKPAPYARQLLTEDMLSNRTPEVHADALARFKAARSQGQFFPFALKQDTVIFPGFDGGAEWGGPAVDPETAILYVNSNEMAWLAALGENTGSAASPKSIYLNQCAICHGDQMAGSPPAIPSLQNVGSRLSPDRIASTIKNGKGRMPGFSSLSSDQLLALVDFLTTGESKEVVSNAPIPPGMKYRFTGYRRFLDAEGYPAIAPPWGTLNAINLNTGEYVWKINLGEFPELAAKGVADTGSENYGGPVVTAGGLVFIAATNFDKKFRAFDKSTGKLLWQTTMPYAGNATPSTYSVAGRQFVVIAAGGGKDLKSTSGGLYIAYSLKP